MVNISAETISLLFQEHLQQGGRVGGGGGGPEGEVGVVLGGAGGTKTIFHLRLPSAPSHSAGHCIVPVA